MRKGKCPAPPRCFLRLSSAASRVAAFAGSAVRRRRSRGCPALPGQPGYGRSMDDENDKNCTLLIPGMHEKFKEQWERVEERGNASDCYVHRITSVVFSKDDAATLGLDWAKVPYGRSVARVTMPSILHGSTGLASKIRRTILL